MRKPGVGFFPPKKQIFWNAEAEELRLMCTGVKVS
jgi:hypothetical protein